jgi:hypothetical protein
MPDDTLDTWVPRQQDICPHCPHDWHGLPCVEYRCHCLGAHLLDQQPQEPDTGKALVKKEET